MRILLSHLRVIWSFGPVHQGAPLRGVENYALTLVILLHNLGVSKVNHHPVGPLRGLGCSG